VADLKPLSSRFRFTSSHCGGAHEELDDPAAA
jgi:hypothetical protein